MARITRRSNPTGLLELDKKQVALSLDRGVSPPVFSLTNLNLQNASLPGDTRVICVARTGRTAQRFDLGRLDAWNRGPQRLTDINASEPLSFRILLRGPTEPKLLASAENVRLRELGQSESLLPIEVTDLGQLAWTYVLEPEGPLLLVNRAVYPHAAVAENDAQFVALVLPEALRRVLWDILSDAEALEDSGDWRSAWRDWLQANGGELPAPAADDREAATKWIDTLIERFCVKSMFCERLLAERHAGEQK
jgi:hypothetical protein